MNPLLQSLLEREKAQRNLIKTAKDAEAAEAEGIKAALHAAFAPFHDSVMALKLRDGYAKPFIFGERPEYLTNVVCVNGLGLHLGRTMNSDNDLHLTVIAREDATPARITLSKGQSVYSATVLNTFEAGHSADDMVRQLLEAMLPQVHDDGLRPPGDTA